MNHLYNVMTKKNKDVLMNLRVREEIRDDIKVVSELRGLSVSALLHQFMVKAIREEKDRDSNEFEKIKESLFPTSEESNPNIRIDKDSQNNSTNNKNSANKKLDNATERMYRNAGPATPIEDLNKKK